MGAAAWRRAVGRPQLRALLVDQLALSREPVSKVIARGPASRQEKMVRAKANCLYIGPGRRRLAARNLGRGPGRCEVGAHCRDSRLDRGLARGFGNRLRGRLTERGPGGWFGRRLARRCLSDRPGSRIIMPSFDGRIEGRLGWRSLYGRRGRRRPVARYVGGRVNRRLTVFVFGIGLLCCSGRLFSAGLLSCAGGLGSSPFSRPVSLLHRRHRTKTPPKKSRRYTYLIRRQWCCAKRAVADLRTTIPAARSPDGSRRPGLPLTYLKLREPPASDGLGVRLRTKFRFQSLREPAKDSFRRCRTCPPTYSSSPGHRRPRRARRTACTGTWA